MRIIIFLSIQTTLRQLSSTLVNYNDIQKLNRGDEIPGVTVGLLKHEIVKNMKLVRMRM